MMRILINSAGALCAYTSVRPWGDRLLRMATLLFGSRSNCLVRELMVPPTHREIVSLV